MPETINGTVERTYFSGATFTAGVLRSEDGNTVRFKGKLFAAEGDHLAATGRWTNDPKYGHQFEILSVTYELPQTREGLVNYLTKNPSFQGIGQKTAEKIVNALGDGQSLDDVLEHSQEILTAAGVPSHVVRELEESWFDRSEENTVRSYLAGFGLTHHQMDTLLEKFGTSIVSMLKHDTYLLIKHLSGYGFKRVDQIALKMGIAKTHPGRIEAALSYCLWEQINSGHTWIGGPELINQANDVLIIDSLNSRELIQEAGNRLIANGDIIADGTAVTSPVMYECEQYVQQLFKGHAWDTDWKPSKDEYEHATAGLGADQLEAFRTAWSSRISVISGGAGTGKTFVVSRLTQAFRERGRVVALCAPTGKAAKRIEQLLKEHGVDASASTIHRLLGYNGREFSEEPIPADVLIVDEVSMVDVRLMATLLRHLKLNKTRLILVGDHNQLPPVGPGNVLRDIIQHNLVPATVMTKVHRQAGVLKSSSVAVLDGEVRRTASDDRSKWILIDRFHDAEAIKNYLRDLVIHDLPKRFGFKPIQDIQIITPQHAGVLGTKSINQMMQYILHADQEEISGRFVVGDKVIQTRNDYELGVMNGTIGVVQEVESDGLLVNFEGIGGDGSLKVNWQQAKDIELAHALTAHKAQGSEFPCAIVLCHKSHFFADRNWLYTAVTRASNTCVLLGDDYGIRRAAQQVRNMNRRTLLSLWSERAQREEAA